MTDNLKALRNVYTIEDMVQICVNGDVVTAASAEYLRRNLVVFFEAAEQKNGRLRERVELLEAAATAAHLEMVAMGNRLNWDMSNHGFPPPYYFPVTFTNTINQLRELTAEGGE